MRFNKKKFMGSGILLIIILFTIYVIAIKNSTSSVNEIESEISSNQWALLNAGQDINGVKGIPGYDIGAREAWEITKGDKEVLVGVLDTGIELENPFIRDNIYMNKHENKNGRDDDGNGFIDDISGWNFYNSNNKLYERMTSDYHGTFITSVIVGEHIKTNEVWGVAPNVTIVPLKFMNGTAGNIDSAIKGIDYGYNLGVRIFNASWDSSEYDEDLFNTIQKYKDAIFITSSGKGKYNVKKNPVYPCNFKLDNIICVSAVDNSGELETYSGYGDNLVFAPGANIYGMLPEGENIYSNGTSLATAYVTGIAALAMSTDPNIRINKLVEILRESKTQIEKDNKLIEIINARQVLDNIKNTK